jgi:TIGR03009 family protein
MLLAGAGVTLGQLPANGTQTGTGYAQGAQDPNSNQQTAGVGSGQLQEPVQPAQMPPISLEEQQYIEKLLEHWEKSSSQIKHCTCEFTRWDYDPQKVSWRDPRNNSLAAHTIMIGQIRYAQPDKAEYESNQAWDFAGPPDQPGGEPKLVERDRTSQHEKWVCDGSAIYDYDYVNKRLYETVIPPEMRGNGLANSPLPFFFGAKKDLILNRYYLRVITPQGAENEYWLEAVPKTREDAQIYQKVQIVIASEDFLPKSLHVFAPNYDPVNNPVSRHFEFQNRKVNSPFAGLNQLLGGGIRPKTPIGWERVDLSSQAAAGAAGASSSLPNGGQPTNGPVIK